uniref:Uncharacterized protein n=1 Tax=Arundo donax TaxID=35708 RepID=A0A0A9G3Z0_ARUDO
MFYFVILIVLFVWMLGVLFQNVFMLLEGLCCILVEKRKSTSMHEKCFSNIWLYHQIAVLLLCQRLTQHVFLYFS